MTAAVAFTRTPFEKAEASLCDTLVRECGGEIVNFSQPRATKQTEGIPDRRYRVFGVCFWFEAKSQDKDAQLTADQADFLLAELNAGCAAACGTLSDLTEYLPAVRGGSGVEYGRYLVGKWIKKGFRKTRKTQKARRHA